MLKDLLRKIDEVSAEALRKGSLLPIDTTTNFVKDAGVNFVVRVVSNLLKKDEQRLKQAGSKKLNPFLPYEQDLFVGDVSDSHIALLNKYNVIARHLLIVTREFRPQEELLNLKDFEALWLCMSQFESLGFYNAGSSAGASQPHKHLQVVPLPLSEDGLECPISPLCDEVKDYDKTTRLRGFDFKHSFIRFASASNKSATELAKFCFEAYCKMLEDLSMTRPIKEDTLQSCPYCLLVTKKWMLLVPRSQEFYKDISINSLGFAGCLLVRKPEQVDLIRQVGPLRILKAVATEDAS